MDQQKPVKCVLVGEGWAGKTALLMALSDGRFPDHIPPQVANVERSVEVDGRAVRVAYWDTHERLRVLAYPETDVFAICFSVTSPGSLDGAREKWYPEVMHHCPTARLLLVGTKCDLRKDPRVVASCAARGISAYTREQAERLARDIDAVYVECSALTGEGVGGAFEEGVARVGLRGQRPPPAQDQRLLSCAIL